MFQLEQRVEEGLLRSEDIQEMVHYVTEAEEHVGKITRVHDG